jgi:hypothetical protein
MGDMSGNNARREGHKTRIDKLIKKINITSIVHKNKTKTGEMFSDIYNSMLEAVYSHYSTQ